MNNAFFSDLLASISERGRTLLRRAGSANGKQDTSDLIELCEALLSGRGEASGTAIRMKRNDPPQSIARRTMSARSRRVIAEAGRVRPAFARSPPACARSR